MNKHEKVVYLGKEKIKVRLFIYLLPEEEYLLGAAGPEKWVCQKV